MTKKLMFALALTSAVAAEALATVPSEISDLTTDSNSVFTTVKGVIITIVSFLVLLRIAKLVTKR